MTLETAEAAAETAKAPVEVQRIFIKATPEQIWEAITSPDFTSRYFYGSQVDSTLEPGSPFVYHSPDRATLWVDGEVLESDPPRRLVHTWHVLYDPELKGEAPSRVTWEIAPTEKGYCKLTVVHDEFEGAAATFKHVSGDGWATVLSGLKTLLETGEPLQSA
jgi:uncharacterized protein YndB with AHSA1/START domain